MFKKNKTKFILGGVLLVAIAIIGTWLAFSKNSPFFEPTWDACVIEHDDNSILIYTNSDNNTGLCYISTIDAEFISYDDSITSIKNIKPGIMIKFLDLDSIVKTSYPGDFEKVKYIKTWGKIDNELYEKGLAEKEALDSVASYFKKNFNRNK